MANELSVIIPAYNEEKSISGTLTQVYEYLSAKKYRFEIIVVNDGSMDQTKQKVDEFLQSRKEVRLIDLRQNGGKGTALKKGMATVHHRLVLFMDADNATKISEWDKFERYFNEGVQVVVGSRHLPGARIIYPQPWFRRFMGAGYRILSRFLFGLHVSDFNCGFKAYQTDIAQRIYSQLIMTDWTFDIEVFCLLRKEGIAVSEVPVSWSHVDKTSHKRVLSIAFKSFFSLLRLKRKFINV